MNQYIIDEKFLKELGGLFFLDEMMLKKINDTLDHPYNPQAERDNGEFSLPPPIKSGKLMSESEIVDIRQAEREKWIQKFDSALNMAGNDREYQRHNLLEVIKELRNQEQP